MYEEAKAEACLRKKPKRIIQNQTLIQLLAMFLGVGCLYFGFFAFWLIFGIAPSIAIPSILALWIVSLIIYAFVWAYSKFQNYD